MRHIYSKKLAGYSIALAATVALAAFPLWGSRSPVAGGWCPQGLERVPGRFAGEFEITDICAQPQAYP